MSDLIKGTINRSSEITGKIHGKASVSSGGNNYLFPTGFWNNALTWLNTKNWKNTP